MEPIKVLQINAGSRNFGGVSAMILNIYRNIDRDKFHFDFLTPNHTTYTQHSDEIKSYGGHIYEFGINNKTLLGKLRFCKTLDTFLKKNPYDIVHINTGILSFNYLVARAVKKHKNIKVFVHSHNGGGRKKWKENLTAPIKKALPKYCDVMLACSHGAKKYMFPEEKHSEVIILNNGIETENYKYDEIERKRIRNELGINNRYVIGNIGRFMKQKNHEFIIDVFADYLKRNNNAILMLLGQGELENHIKNKVKELCIEKNVLFLGQRAHIQEYYQAMDCFFLPSLYEGFPVTIIEAQCCGLPCVVSNAVPAETDIIGKLLILSLDDSRDKWINALDRFGPSQERHNFSHIVMDSGFDISKTVTDLEKLYQENKRSK